MDEDVPVVLINSTLTHDDEFPEEHIGDELIDPWVDPEQTDWPNADEIEIRKEES